MIYQVQNVGNAKKFVFLAFSIFSSVPFGALLNCVRERRGGARVRSGIEGGNAGGGRKVPKKTNAWELWRGSRRRASFLGVYLKFI